MTRIRRGLALVCWSAIVFGACQQELVVIDGQDGTATGTGAGGASGGGGGGGGAPNPTASSSTQGGECAGAPAATPPLVDCRSGSVATVTGGPPACQSCVRDGTGKEFITYCEDGFCTCSVDLEPICQCPQIVPGSCDPTCCPPPWNALD